MTPRGLAQKSLSIAGRDLFLFATNLATGVLVARVLGPAGLGVWVIFQLILSYAEALGRPKFDQAAIYYIGRGTHEAGKVTFILHVLAVASSALLLAVAILAIEPLYGLLFKDGPDVHGLLIVVLLQIPAQFVYLNYAYLHISREDIGAYNRMTILRALSNSVLVVALLVVADLGLGGVVWASLLSTLAGLAYGAILLHRHLGLVPAWDGRIVRDLAGYGAKLYVAGLVGQLNNQLTNALCAVYLLPAQLAYFSVAAARRDIINVLPNAVNTILFPRLSGTSDRIEAARLTALTARILFLVLVCLGMVAVVIVRPAVFLLYGSAYLPVVEPFLVLLPGFILVGAASPYLQYLLGIGRPDLTVKLAAPPVVIQLALAAWLVPAYGIGGAAIALVVPLLVGSLLTLTVFLRLSAMPLGEALVVRRHDLVLLREVTKRELARFRHSRSDPRSSTI